jgi:uncharacterized protein (UPF0335 family)
MHDNRKTITQAEEIATILATLERLERRINDVAEDVDTIDRTLRPYGDGTKVLRRGRR